MPKIVKMYGKSRRGLKHNMGGWFEKKEKPPEPTPAPTPAPKPPKEDKWVKSTKKGIKNRRDALKELMKD